MSTRCIRVRLWFFVGDSIDWLNRHRTLSGVPRVTIELFWAAVKYAREQPRLEVIPCILGPTKSELVGIPEQVTSGFLASRTGRNGKRADYLRGFSWGHLRGLFRATGSQVRQR